MAQPPSGARPATCDDAWLLDLIERTLEVLRLEGQRWIIVAVHAGHDEVRAEPFEATSLALARLWVD